MFICIFYVTHILNWLFLLLRWQSELEMDLGIVKVASSRDTRSPNTGKEQGQ